VPVAVLCALRVGTASNRLDYFAAGQEAEMAHWRKRNPTASQFNAYLAGWTVAFSVIFVTLILLSLHGRV
jgi:hypothetical protein